MAKGDYSIRYDPDRLREMIEKGMSAKEITKEFEISPYTLREHLVMLQDLDKKIYVVEGLFDYSQVEKSKIQKEGVVFSKEMLE
ncbi:MAG: helix-turn-helix domain-containing protein, partial [Desulfobacterales bacterium]